MLLFLSIFNAMPNFSFFDINHFAYLLMSKSFFDIVLIFQNLIFMIYFFDTRQSPDQRVHFFMVSLILGHQKLHT